MLIIPKIKEWHARYKTSFVVIMEPQDAFVSRAMR